MSRPLLPCRARSQDAPRPRARHLEKCASRLRRIRARPSDVPRPRSLHLEKPASRLRQIHAPIALAAAVALAAACAGSPPAPPSAPIVVVPPSASPSAEPPPSDRDEESLLAATVCGIRPACTVKLERKAGQDGPNRMLSIVTVHTGLGPAEPEEDAVLDPAVADASYSVSSGQEDIEGSDSEQCHHYEHWLVVRGESMVIESAEKLTEICGDGHGSTGGDWTRVSDGAFEHVTSGGSASRWSERKLLGLAPLRWKQWDTGEYWTGGPNLTSSTFDYETFVGWTAWHAPPCNADGEAEWDEANAPGPGDDDRGQYAYVEIPRLALDPAFTGDGWKTTSIARCSASVDAADERGLVVSGKPGQKGDASLHVLASGNELFIEVGDDKITGPSSRPKIDDHLELWLATALPNYSDSCLQPGGETPISWEVRLADGKVFPGFGKPKTNAPSVTRGGAPGRLRVELPPGSGAVTVVYADGDDGRSIERRIATSRLAEGDRKTLGALRAMTQEEGGCRVEGGALVPVGRPFRGLH
jgi:hypothetical protein